MSEPKFYKPHWACDACGWNRLEAGGIEVTDEIVRSLCDSCFTKAKKAAAGDTQEGEG